MKSYEALISKDLTKKRKTWHDGIVEIRDAGLVVVRLSQEIPGEKSVLFSGKVDEVNLRKLLSSNDDEFKLSSVLISIQNEIPSSACAPSLNTVDSNFGNQCGQSEMKLNKFTVPNVKSTTNNVSSKLYSKPFSCPKPIVATGNDTIQSGSSDTIGSKLSNALPSALPGSKITSSTTLNMSSLSAKFSLGKPFTCPRPMESNACASNPISSSTVQSRLNVSLSNTASPYLSQKPPAQQINNDPNMLIISKNRTKRTKLIYENKEAYFSDFYNALLEEILLMIFANMISYEHIILGLLTNNVISKTIPRAILFNTCRFTRTVASSDVELVVSGASYFANGQSMFRGKRKLSEEDDEDCKRDEPSEKKIFLKFPISSRDIPKSVEMMSRGDIWLIWETDGDIYPIELVQSKYPLIQDIAQRRDKFINARRSQHYPFPWHDGVLWQDAYLVRSNWYSMSEKSMIEVSPFDEFGKRSPFFNRNRSKLSSIRLLNDPTSLISLDILNGGKSANLTIGDAKTVELLKCPVFLYGILRTSTSSHRQLVSPMMRGTSMPEMPKFDNASISKFEESISNYFLLNQDQQMVLRRVGNWFRHETSGANDNIVLVHGVFGSGKSHLLVAICAFLRLISLSASRNQSSMKLRCLVSSNTNVAVDRILIGILEAALHAQLNICEQNDESDSDSLEKGLSSMKIARVGCPSKIDKQLRRNIVLMHDSKASMQRELAMMMHTDKDPVLKKMCEDCKNPGHAMIQRKMITDSDVVGVTCASSTCQLLQESYFPILILDEASQMTEPISLLPMYQAKPCKMLVVGDPNQLPPTLSVPGLSPATRNQTDSSVKSDEADLTYTLFDRLIGGGIAPIMLRYQYRCHPKIADVCSELFYDGNLKHGVTELQRKSLLGSIEPVVVVHCQGQEKKEGDSVINHGEATSICNLVHSIKNKCPSLSVGVICMYKPQVRLINHMLNQNGESVDTESCRVSEQTIKVSTVDAFQGQELDIVIVSTCRTQATSFLSNPCRVNVAISRARHHVIIFGDSKMMSTDKLWSQIQSRSIKFANLNAFLQSMESFESTTSNNFSIQEPELLQLDENHHVTSTDDYLENSVIWSDFEDMPDL